MGPEMSLSASVGLLRPLSCINLHTGNEILTEEMLLHLCEELFAQGVGDRIKSGTVCFMISSYWKEQDDGSNINWTVTR